MKSRIEKYEKYRSRIARAPEWSFRLDRKSSSKHSADERAMEGKSIGSRAILLESEKKGPRIVGYEKYRQSKQTINILKYTLFAVSIIFMIVLYITWAR